MVTMAIRWYLATTVSRVTATVTLMRSCVTSSAGAVWAAGATRWARSVTSAPTASLAVLETATADVRRSCNNTTERVTVFFIHTSEAHVTWHVAAAVGVTACECNIYGTTPGSGCDKRTGHCDCRPHYTGRDCGQCAVSDAASNAPVSTCNTNLRIMM